MNELAPVVLFVYNRPVHTRKTLESLSKNLLADQSKLFIYSDGPHENSTEEERLRITEVRKVIAEKKWCAEVEIIERNKNFGLAKSVISGVTEIINRFGKIIVLEDDLVLSRGFLKYMNESLLVYENDERVMHVSGYMFPVKTKLPETFFSSETTSWGWATWSRAWKFLEPDAKLLAEKINKAQRKDEFDLQGNYNYYDMLVNQAGNKNDSWAVRWYASVFLNKGLVQTPGISLVRNIGNDSSGIHCRDGWWTKIYENQKIADEVRVRRNDFVVSEKARAALKKFYLSLNNPPLLTRVKEKAKIIFRMSSTKKNLTQ
jgi:hypothetical protein